MGIHQKKLPKNFGRILELCFHCLLSSLPNLLVLSPNQVCIRRRVNHNRLWMHCFVVFGMDWISHCRPTTVELPNKEIRTSEDPKAKRLASTLQERIHQIRFVQRFQTPKLLLLNLNLVGGLSVQCEQHGMELLFCGSCFVKPVVFRIHCPDRTNFNRKVPSLQRLSK